MVRLVWQSVLSCGLSRPASQCPQVRLTYCLLSSQLTRVHSLNEMTTPSNRFEGPPHYFILSVPTTSTSNHLVHNKVTQPRNYYVVSTSIGMKWSALPPTSNHDTFQPQVHGITISRVILLRDHSVLCIALWLPVVRAERFAWAKFHSIPESTTFLRYMILPQLRTVRDTEVNGAAAIKFH
jgi:hypothetical protein